MGWETRTITATVQVWVPDELTFGSLPVGSASYPAPAGALFVSPAGDDSSPGTEVSPFRTLEKAVASLAPGGTVVLREGTYREADIWNFVENTTIQNYPGEAVWLDGTDPFTEWTREGDLWWAPYTRTTDREVLWQNLHTVGPVPAWVCVVLLDGTQLTQVEHKTDVRPGTYWQQGALDGDVFTAQRVYIGDDPTGRLVEVSQRAIAVTMHAPGQTIRGVGVRGYTADRRHMGCVLRMVRAGATLENVRVEDCTTDPLGVIEAPNVTIRDVSVARASQLAVSGWRADNLRIEGCHITGSNIHGWNMGHGAGAIKTTKTHKVTVDRCLIENNDSVGVWFDEATYDMAVVNSIFRGNASTALFIEICGKALVANCLVTGHSQGGIVAMNSDRVRVWNCTVLDCGFGNLRGVQETRLPADGQPNQDPRQPASFYDTDMTWVIGSHDGIQVRNCVTGFTKAAQYPAGFRYNTQGGGWTVDVSWEDAKLDVGHTLFYRATPDACPDPVALTEAGGSYVHPSPADFGPGNILLEGQFPLDGEHRLTTGHAGVPLPDDVAALVATAVYGLPPSDPPPGGDTFTDTFTPRH